MVLKIKNKLFIFALLVMHACSSPTSNIDNQIDTLEWKEIPNQYATNFAIQTCGKEQIRLLIFADATRKDTLNRLYKGKITGSQNRYIVIDTSLTLASLSSAYIGFLDAINQTFRIKFVDEGDYITSEKVRNRLEKGAIKECGSGEQLNYELLLNSKPLVLSYQIEGGSNSVIQRLSKYGVPVLNLTDFKEANPLGRAEWLKFFGVLCNQETEANNLFNEVEEHYQQTKYFCDRIAQKPSVFSGNLFSGVWNVSGGKSFLAQLIKDAGGNYVFEKDTAQLNLIYTFEKIFTDCKETEVWINPGVYSTYAKLKEEDSRYALFKAFKEKNVYNNHKILNGFGGNAFWEIGVVRPDLVLLDLASCFHPQFFMHRTNTFYKPLD